MTQYESIIDPTETWMEKWVLHEADRSLQLLQLRGAGGQSAHQSDLGTFLDYELGQLQFVIDVFKKMERRDPAEILPAPFRNHRLQESTRVRSHRSSETSWTSRQWQGNHQNKSKSRNVRWNIVVN